MIEAEPIRNKKHIKEISAYYFKRGQLRNYLLMILGLYTALRISDLLSLAWEDVYDFGRGEFNTHIYFTERKTRKRKAIALNKQTIAALRLCFSAPDINARRFLFKSNRKDGAAIGRIQGLSHYLCGGCCRGVA